jgi:hypothetical protein
MSMYLSAAQGHKELVNQLNGELAKLRLLLEQPGGIRVDSLFPLPLRHTPSVAKKETIAILGPDEVDYRSEAIDNLTSMWLRPGQHPKETLRTPGCCAVSFAAIEQINACNSIRMELINLLAEVPTADRTPLWRAHSNISSHQTLRMTPVLQDPQKIRFYWDRGDSITKFTVADLVYAWAEKLTKLQGDVCASSQCEPDTLNFRLALSIERLSMLPSNEWVAVRRILPPHVRARVRDGDDDPYITSAPVPFVYSHACLAPSVTPLTDHDPEAPASQKKRSTRIKLMSEPYIDAMNVFRYKDQSKAMGPVSRESMRNTRKKPI